jgi:hypothetical protein
MKNQSKIHLSAVVIPCLLIFAMVVSPLLSQSSFHRTKHIWYGSACSDTGNAAMETHHRYFPELDSAGFNRISNPGWDQQWYPGYLNSSWYDSLHLYTSTGKINEYGYAQDRTYGVGTGLQDYFTEVYYPNVEDMYLDQSQNPPIQVFRSRFAVNDSGYVINTNLEPNDQRLPRNYCIALRIKIDTTGTGASLNDPVITVQYRKNTPLDQSYEIYLSPNSLQQFGNNGSLSGGTDNDSLYTAVVIVDSLPNNQYTTVKLWHSMTELTFQDLCWHSASFRVFWHKKVDFYLDWVRISDQEADGLWYAGTTVRNCILDTLRGDMHWLDSIENYDGLIEGLFIDEPFPVSMRAVGAIDTLSTYEIGTMCILLFYLLTLIHYGVMCYTLPPEEMVQL